jgi:flavin-binding protein dodecin
MAVVKVIELLGESEQGWDDAARKVVEEATKVSAHPRCWSGLVGRHRRSA